MLSSPSEVKPLPVAFTFKVPASIVSASLALTALSTDVRSKFPEMIANVSLVLIAVL